MMNQVSKRTTITRNCRDSYFIVWLHLCYLTHSHTYVHKQDTNVVEGTNNSMENRQRTIRKATIIGTSNGLIRNDIEPLQNRSRRLKRDSKDESQVTDQKQNDFIQENEWHRNAKRRKNQMRNLERLIVINKTSEIIFMIHGRNRIRFLFFRPLWRRLCLPSVGEGTEKIENHSSLMGQTVEEWEKTHYRNFFIVLAVLMLFREKKRTEKRPKLCSTFYVCASNISHFFMPFLCARFFDHIFPLWIWLFNVKTHINLSFVNDFFSS